MPKRITNVDIQGFVLRLGGIEGERATVPTGGLVTESNEVTIYFSACVVISGTTGIEVNIDDGGWVEVSGYSQVSDTIVEFTVGSIAPGDTVQWRYAGGSGTLVDCEESEDIGDQFINVDNPLELAGDFILLETGGSDIVLLEYDVDATNGALTEEAT